jgi:hypothetical protein
MIQPNNSKLSDTKEHLYAKLSEAGITSVDVGNKVFSIGLASNLKHNDDCVDGVTLFDKSTILLDTDLGDWDARETLIHEVLHCLLDNAGLDESHFHGESIITTNEQLVSVVAKQLLLLYRLNPKLLATLYPLPKNDSATTNQSFYVSGSISV